MYNYKTIEKEVDQKFEEVLLNMEPEEIKEYFKKLIEKYYSAIFSFEQDFDKRVENANEKYGNIEKVKNVLKERFSMDEIEDNLRLRHVEEIAYSQMKEINYMEIQYSNIIYNYATMELTAINGILTDLINLYKIQASPELISVVGNTLIRCVYLLKEVKKLPLNEVDLQDSIEKEDEIKSKLQIPDLSLNLKKQLEIFEDNFKDLKKILPKDIITNFETALYSSEKLYFLNLMLKCKPENKSDEEIYKTVACMDYIKNYNDTGYLYGIISRWD